MVGRFFLSGTKTPPPPPRSGRIGWHDPAQVAKNFAQNGTMYPARGTMYHREMLTQAQICVCDQCGHRWLSESGLPVRCPSRKCRSKNWNAGATATAPPPTFVPKIELDRKMPENQIKVRGSDVTIKNIGLPSVDSDNRARLDKLNAAKYQKKK